MAPGFPQTVTRNSFAIKDDMSLLRGAHRLRWGGSLTRFHIDREVVGLGSILSFLSWPDFLLGLDATQNGTNLTSNVFGSVDTFGPLGRRWRAWQGSAYVEDDIRVREFLTLNLGLRYERMGQFGDELGRNSAFDTARANRNPPAEGSLAGYVVASNYSGVVPAGVTRASNEFATNGQGQNALAPRVGFAWRIFSKPSDLVLRGGYGLYFSSPTLQAFGIGVFSPPFSITREAFGPPNAHATFEHPFPTPFPTAASFPAFPAYSPTTALSVVSVAQDFRPALLQQFGLNLQAGLQKDLFLEVGYVGVRGTHLQRTRSLNQALNASPATPVRGQTTNTLANIPERVPFQGMSSQSLIGVESAGNSWYNGLEASLTKRLSGGLQLLASYTFSKTLDTDGANINGISAGNTSTSGDQNSPRQRWGRPSFDRSQRFVLSATYSVPSPGGRTARMIVGNWTMSGVVTIQSGTALTVIYTNPTNVYGFTRDRAQLTADCNTKQLVTPGRVQANLKHYFSVTCFTSPPVIGADGIGTAFGNSSTGMVNGPSQANIDFALSKAIPLGWPRDGGHFEVRGEFFNALNHPQFANPDNNFSSPTFGAITSTAVNPRVVQLALKFGF